MEGNSIRATVRMTGVPKNTIAKLLVDPDAACAAYQDEKLRNLPSKRLQCDEIWSFCYAKQRNVTEDILEKNPDAGDVWTWTCLDPDSKLMVTWHVGGRTTSDTHEFISDVATRVSDRVQISTDGLGQYIRAIVEAFGENVDLGQVIKQFACGNNPGRYSPPVCVGCENKTVIGNPDPKHISTSYIERCSFLVADWRVAVEWRKVMSNDQKTDQKESRIQDDDQPDDQLIRLVMEEESKARAQRNLPAIKAWEAVEFAVKDAFAASNNGDFI